MENNMDSYYVLTMDLNQRVIWTDILQRKVQLFLWLVYEMEENIHVRGDRGQWFLCCRLQ